jgi:hypothetical protein
LISRPINLARVLALLLVFVSGLGSTLARADDSPRSLVLMDLRANHVDPSTVLTIQSLVTVQLDRYPSLKVIAGEDVRQMLDLEAQKQAMGCDDEGSCLAEIAGALGAELVVTGEIGRLDDNLILTLNLFDASKKEAINRSVVRADGLATMSSGLEKGVAVLVKPVVSRGEEFRLPQAEVISESDSGPWPWITMGAGLFVCGGCCASSGFPALIWLNAMAESSNMRRMRDTYSSSETTPEEARELRQLYDESRASWNGGLWQSYWLMVGLAAIGLATGTGGLVWGLVE